MYDNVLPWSNVAVIGCLAAVTEYTKAVTITTVNSNVFIMTSVLILNLGPDCL